MPAGAGRSHQGCRRDSPGSQGTRGEGWHTPTSPACLPTAAHHGPTMWAGTNSGSVFAYALEVPAAVAGGEKRPERAVEAVLGKEVQLMHRAPVVAIAVLDGRGRPLPEPYEASRDLAQAPDMQGGHAVLIASEEQFKVISLQDPLGFSSPGHPGPLACIHPCSLGPPESLQPWQRHLGEPWCPSGPLSTPLGGLAGACGVGYWLPT